MKILDRKIISLLDTSFPVSAHPFTRISEMVKLDEQELLKRINMYLEKGYIKRIGALFTSDLLGYKNTLAYATVAKNRVSEISKILDNINGVTTSYLRDNDYNMWFTLIAKNDREINKKLQEIEAKTDVQWKTIQPKTMFKLEPTIDYIPQEAKSPAKDAPTLKEWEREFIRILQNNVTVIHEPFHEISDTLNISAERILQKLDSWIETGVIRKFGAVLRIRNVDFKTNIMILANLNARQAQKVGKQLAKMREISQCCSREKTNDFPYNFFTVFHVRNKEEGEVFVKKTLKELEITNPKYIFTKKELKKEGMKFFVE